ncbi:hypothetical protein DL766_010404 [Monosporascus sp. MC13-8B]|uniref:Cyanovirin-N domain-containing protein n=1 Tax=Monosporascus cannonballus TaxID=155416 RepID=A0ABY0HBW0_9PEZI|nr:hypothetical protein DL762_002958 [Monosporascus cannonballus]RYO96609.1 hypothetical protein DL763_003095 [Monosporascus cannonballus]RYP02367.1 hypothetical protein DL766_010404 [Monosporascus sp. MC13-8B]
MKSTTILSSIIIGFVLAIGAAAVPLEDNSPNVAGEPRQLQGKVCARSGTNEAAGEGIIVTAITLANETTSLDKPQANFDGFCSPNNQICQLRWREGIFVCQGYCHCSNASPVSWTSPDVMRLPNTP